MAWTQQGTGTAVTITAGSGSQSVALPGTPAAGDLVVVAVAGDVNCQNSVTTSGYTKPENGTGANPGAHLAYKRLTTNETTVAVARNATILKSCVVQVWRGSDVEEPLDQTYPAAATGTSAAPNPPSIVTQTASALVFAIAWLDDDDSTVNTYPTNYTNGLSANTGQSSTTVGSTVAICSREIANAGTEDPGAYEMSSSDAWSAGTIAFRMGGPSSSPSSSASSSPSSSESSSPSASESSSPSASPGSSSPSASESSSPSSSESSSPSASESASPSSSESSSPSASPGSASPSSSESTSPSSSESSSPSASESASPSSSPSSAPTLDQEGYRWRNDNGDETTATWRQAQDTEDSATRGTIIRLRVLVNATGDPASQQFTLQYRKQGDVPWNTMEVEPSLPSGTGAVEVGPAYTDGSPRQIVRSSTGYLYAIGPNCYAYPDFTSNGMAQTIRVWRADDLAAPPTGFTRMDSGNEPAACVGCAAAIDGNDDIHIAWEARSSSTNTRYLRYAVFDTGMDTWGSVTTILSNLDYDDWGQGDENCAIAIDAANKAHVVFASGATRRLYYTNNVSGSWAAATQVDDDITYQAGQESRHPGIGFDEHGRLIVSWLAGGDNNDANTDGVVYVRTRETGGTWNSSVSVITGLYDGIDQCVSLVVTADGRYHLACGGAKSGGFEPLKYFYSDNHGATWSANHPTGSTHNVALGLGAAANSVRIWYHGTGSPVNLYYQEGGGSGEWGGAQLFDSGTFECSPNARWSQYHHQFPAALDVAYWDAIYSGDGNVLYVGCEV